jgi:predicted deacylase
MSPSSKLTVGGQAIPRGEGTRVDIPVAGLPTQTMLHLPVTVLRGRRDGPSLFLSAALHGDEIDGVEIIRRVLDGLSPDTLRGTLFAVPIVNVFGFVHQSRYLPDRRDLNRSFPGSDSGSMAAQLAHSFMHEVVRHCDVGIDLHTASHFRTNLPQTRADLRNDRIRELALAFDAPVTMHSKPPRGSLRAAAARRRVNVLVYEGGEVMRFTPEVIRAGVAGVRRVMATMGMTRDSRRPRRSRTFVSGDSRWVRARRSGIARISASLGDRVTAQESLGTVSGPLGERQATIRATADGIVVGLRTNPLVNRGEAIAHIALAEAAAD